MKKQKTILKGFAFLSVAVITLFVIMLAFVTNKNLNPSESYTVYSDEEYYSETTYYLSEEAYNASGAENERPNAAARNLAAMQKNSTKAKDGGEFVLAVEKKVYVAETYDNDGNATNSRLLKKSEVDAYKNSCEQTIGDQPMILSSATHSLGTDREEYFALSIMLTADYYADLDYYGVSGFSSWNKDYPTYDTKQNAEREYEDYVGFTWGGEGTLEGDIIRTVGNYEDSSQISASKCLSDPYGGVVWQFLERNKSGSPAGWASSYVNISKVGAMLNKVTSVRFTYIHTYGAVRGTVSFTLSSNGTIAGGISLSETEKQWQIEVSLAGFEY